MGALTLKSFPFELRGWDIEKFESIDPTDGFGSSTKVYINKQQIVQIEPDYNITTSNNWISDKGRQFFDGIFGQWDSNNQENLILKKQSWYSILKYLFKNLYLFDHCNNKQKQNYFFNIIFENLSIDMLNLLIILSQNYSFIKIKRAENINLNNDLESNFQLNATSSQTKLNSSSLCLLIANNPRYEGYHLNLHLRQRFLKGNFKCLTIGSLIDLTFPVDFLGTNLKTIKTIIEGNNFICQNLKSAENAILVFNTEIFKRHDGKNILNIIKILRYSNLFNQTWNGLNILNFSLYETGLHSVAKFNSLTNKDLIESSSFYLINLTTNNISNFKKITEIKLLNFNNLNKSQPKKISQIFIDQNNQIKSNLNFYKAKYLLKNNKLDNYFYLPTKIFYENSEIFVNTEGVIKYTLEVISKKKTKNNWKILRNFLNHFKNHINFFNKKNNSLIFFNSKKKLNFQNFSNFQYYATKTFDNNTILLNTNNQSFFISSNNNSFKLKKLKLMNTKLKYWLDDFFIGGKDGYSQNSLTLINCSDILKTQTTNFF